MINRDHPSEWFKPFVILDTEGRVILDIMDENLDNNYENGQGILIPVVSHDGRVLSEKRQKQIVKHFVSDFSRTHFDLLIGVLRKDPADTAEQIHRWCDLFKRITGEVTAEKAFDKMHIKGFAVCVPRHSNDIAAQREALIGALSFGLPVMVYCDRELSKTDTDPDLIRGLSASYSNLIAVLDADGCTHDPLIYANHMKFRVEEAKVIEAAGTDEETVAEIVEESVETVTEEVNTFEEVSESAEAAEAVEEIAADEPEEKPVRLIDLLYDRIHESELEEAAAEAAAKAAAEERAAKAALEAKKEKRLIRIIVAELAACLLIIFGLYNTFSVQDMGRRSLDLADASAQAFVTNASIDFGKGHEKVGNGASEAILQAKLDRLREAAANLEYIPEERSYDIENSETYKMVQGTFEWGGAVINRRAGTVTGPNGRETYYNLNMSHIVARMNSWGYNDTYWVRSDGCKMLGNYIMVAANLNVHPRGSIVRCSRGLAIVADTGGFAASNPQQLDIAADW